MNKLQELHDAGWTVEVWNTYDRVWCIRLRYGTALIHAERETLSETVNMATVLWRDWFKKQKAAA